ncbi:VapD family protein [Helicobacter sp. T3_23-1056]
MGIDKNEQKYIKYIIFDLDTKQLKDIFPDTRLPYSMIKKFFEDNGFEHRQYSGYISKELLDNFDIIAIMKELGKKFTWLRNCIQEFDVSNVINEVSVKDQIINSAIQQERQKRQERLKKAKQITQNPPKPNTPTTPKPKPRRR